MLQKIRDLLASFHSYARGFEDYSELRHAIVSMLVKLIEFWATVVWHLRKTTTGQRQAHASNEKLIDLAELLMITNWPTLNGEFETTLQEIEAAVTRVQNLAAHATAQEENAKKRHEDDVLLQLVTDDEQSAAKFPYYDIPVPNAHFHGRRVELDAIAEHFGFPIASSSSAVVAISGLGGVGKSSLVTAFAERCKATKVFDAIIWIRSETPEDIKSCFNRTANGLELPRASKQGDNDSNVFAVRSWLGKTCKSYNGQKADKSTDN